MELYNEKAVLYSYLLPFLPIPSHYVYSTARRKFVPSPEPQNQPSPPPGSLYDQIFFYPTFKTGMPDAAVAASAPASASAKI